jgi:hypothetical protein
MRDVIQSELSEGNGLLGRSSRSESCAGPTPRGPRHRALFRLDPEGFCPQIYAVLSKPELAVRLSVSPRFRHHENEMNDQREENKHHQIEQFSLVYHSCLPSTPLIKGKARAKNLCVGYDHVEMILQGNSVG